MNVVIKHLFDKIIIYYYKNIIKLL